LETAKTKKIYMHYFDVDDTHRAEYGNDGLYPVYVLKRLDMEYADYDIVPVVFITNEALKKANIKELSERIHKLVDQISMHRLDRTYNDLQLDCDWTLSTKDKYFELIELLSEHYTVSVTIRLHQIKYKEKTGVPPCGGKGVLMVYNVGELSNLDQNSILESSIVADYIYESSSYPLELDVALPLFSQTVLINKKTKIRLVKGADRKAIESSSQHFKAIDKNMFEVVKDTLYHGFFLSEGYKLKLEELSEDEVVASYDRIKQSSLEISDVIFYHLDDQVLENINLQNIIKRL